MNTLFHFLIELAIKIMLKFARWNFTTDTEGEGK